MDFTSLVYFTEAVKDLNFTNTAKRLFISQQNLSNHIARLESYYDVKLFERKPKLALTYAGQVLLGYAENFKIGEENLKTVLFDMKQQEIGMLSIGVSPSRTSIVAPALADIFNQKYPNVELHYFHHHSTTLNEMLLDGRLDFIIGIDKEHHPHIESFPIFKDTLFVIIADELLKKSLGPAADQFLEKAENGIQIKDIVDIPIINIRSTDIVKDCFKLEGYEPNFTVTSNYPQFFMPNYYENIAASIVTKTVYLHIKDTIPSHIHVYPLRIDTTNLLNDISIIKNKRKILSIYAEHFIEISQKYFHDLAEKL